MHTRDFDFHLPAELIAQRPESRGQSRLLFVDGTPEGKEHGRVADLPERLNSGDVLVVNDTKVLKARLHTTNPTTGGRVEILLLEQIDDREWTALAKPGKKARPGTCLKVARDLEIECLEPEAGGPLRVRFSRPVEGLLDQLGHVPLPPYIRRPDGDSDSHDYQTVFARHPGAIAAPTAGLHFSDEMLDRIRAKGVAVAPVTLHVGIGTFKPVTAERLDEHVMESERYSLPVESAAKIQQARCGGGRIIAVGTTVVRTLETVAARFSGGIEPCSGRTQLFIRPGYRFLVVDALLTNFHLPRSTLLMLVSAFAGSERVRRAYELAIENGYRFYSYGDAMFLERQRTS